MACSTELSNGFVQLGPDLLVSLSYITHVVPSWSKDREMERLSIWINGHLAPINIERPLCLSVWRFLKSYVSQRVEVYNEQVH